MSKEKKESKESNASKLEKRIVELEEKWKRAVADYRNLEKHVAKEREEFAKFSNFILISKLLPVLDDFEEAAQKSADPGAAKILKKFRGILEEEGLSEIEALGKEFDPELMEGLPDEETSGETPPRKTLRVEEETLRVEESAGVGEAAGLSVVEVLRKGYTLNGRMLRPARVKLG